MKMFFDFLKGIITSVLLLAVILSGCGTTKKLEQNQSSKLSDNVQSENAVKLYFTYWGSQNEKMAIEAACRKFSEKNPGIAIEPIQIPNSDYNRVMVQMSAANNSPDLSYMTPDLGEIWAKEGRFINLFDRLLQDKEIKKEEFLDYIWYKADPDNAWGISTAGECFGLYYNKDLLNAVGIDSLPTTADKAMDWDTFVNLAKKLTIDKNGKTAADPGFDPKNITQYGIMFETWSEPLNNFIYSNGGKWISEDGKKFALNSPEAAEAIQKLADLINVHHVAPSPLTAKSMPAMNIALQSRLVAMAVGGQWINLDLGKAKVNYDIGVLPKMKKSITIGISGATVIFNSSSHHEEAWMLLKWMSNPESAIELYSSGLWMPTMKKWYTDPKLVSKWVDSNPAAHPPGFKNAMMYQLLQNGIPQPRYYLKNQAKIEPVVISGLDPVWFGKKTAAEALKEIEKKVQTDILGRFDVQ